MKLQEIIYAILQDQSIIISDNDIIQSAKILVDNIKDPIQIINFSKWIKNIVNYEKGSI